MVEGEFPVTVVDGTVVGHGKIIGTQKKKGGGVEVIVSIEFTKEIKDLITPQMVNDISIDFNDRYKQGEKQDG